MSVNTGELQILQTAALGDYLVMDTTKGTARLPLSQLPKILTADKLLMPGGATSIEQFYRYMSGRNLLDNWYLADPINQRGLTKYTGDGYGIDRWRAYALTVTVENGFIKIKNNAETVRWFYQLFEPKLIHQFAGKVLTVSALYKCDTGRCGIRSSFDGPDIGGYHESGETSLGSNNEWDLASFSTSPISALSSDPDIWQPIVFDIVPGATLCIKAAKLEAGTRQTLAHKEGSVWVLNDPPPNKALELAKCQRYYYYHVGNSCSGYCSGNLAYFNIPIPVSMRVVPAVSIGYKNNIVDAGGGVYAVNSVVNVYANSAGIVVVCDTDRPSDAARSVFANADVQFILDANL